MEKELSALETTRILPRDLTSFCVEVITDMTAPGARGSVIGNNPFAFAVPAGEERPVFLDMALSTVATGKIYAAQSHGSVIPDNCLVDEEGRRLRISAAILWLVRCCLWLATKVMDLLSWWKYWPQCLWELPLLRNGIPLPPEAIANPNRLSAEFDIVQICRSE